MTKIIVFPGQGAQFLGMGAALFAKYPRLVRDVDGVLLSARLALQRLNGKVFGRTGLRRCQQIMFTSAIGPDRHCGMDDDESRIADGYSVKYLCLKDPEKRLDQTAYTQPALYVVNALSYLEKQKFGQPPIGVQRCRAAHAGCARGCG